MRSIDVLKQHIEATREELDQAFDRSKDYEEYYQKSLKLDALIVEYLESVAEKETNRK